MKNLAELPKREITIEYEERCKMSFEYFYGYLCHRVQPEKARNVAFLRAALAGNDALAGSRRTRPTWPLLVDLIEIWNDSQ